MTVTNQGDAKAQDLEKLHAEAESRIKTFRYKKPSGYAGKKALVELARTDILRGLIQVVPDGGENNLHYHPSMDSIWVVLKGRVRFYGPEDKLLGEFGPMEGLSTPRNARYWFESAGDEELELLQVAAIAPDIEGPMRVDASPRKWDHDTNQHFDAESA